MWIPLFGVATSLAVGFALVAVLLEWLGEQPAEDGIVYRIP